MAQIKCKAAAMQMRKEYGENSCAECYDCCNRQRKNRTEQTKVCIAFSSDIPWNGAERACGLFNIPFRGIRPAKLPLNDVRIRKRCSQLVDTVCDNQVSLFMPKA